jgi:hypothetical protein
MFYSPALSINANTPSPNRATIRAARRSKRARPVIDIDSGHVFSSATEAAAVHGCSPAAVSNAISRVTRGKGKRWALLGDEDAQAHRYARKGISMRSQG